MPKLSKDDESKLLSISKEAAALVHKEGMTPHDAMCKVAKARDLTPGFVRLMCNSYNTGNQLAQWNKEASVLGRLGEFELANYSAVHDTLWGDAKNKKASAPVSAGAPTIRTYDDLDRESLMETSILNKVASDTQEDAKPKAEKLSFDEHAYSSARREYSAAQDRLSFSLHNLNSYFDKFAYDRESLASVEYSAKARYGKKGEALMDYIGQTHPKEKRASDHSPQWSGFQKSVDFSKSPYTLIENCVKAAEDYNGKAAAWKTAEAEREVYEAQLDLRRKELLKSAGAASGIVGGLSIGAGNALTKALTQEATKKKRQYMQSLDAPDHTDQLRKIRAQTVLAELMADTDSPIGDHPQEEILSAYNSIVGLTPRAAEQPALLQTLLQKRLLGNTEPFEVAEQMKMDQALKATQSTTAKVPEAMKDENSILG